MQALKKLDWVKSCSYLADQFHHNYCFTAKIIEKYNGIVELRHIFVRLVSFNFKLRTRTLLVALSLACLEMSFVVKDPGAVILLFRLEYKTSVVCHNVYTQKVKIARRDRPHILASNRCETFENLLHIDIAPLRNTLSRILHSKN